MELRTLNNQDGIALGPILFIIAILAILAAAIAAGSGSFTANTSAEQAKSNAEALVQYADQLSMAVQKVYIDNGCTDTQINFYNPNDVNPINLNAPSDSSCDIYDPRGGGVTYHNFSALPIFDPSRSTAIASLFGLSVGQFSEGFANTLTGFGNNPTLTFEIFGLNINTCTAINKLVNYNPPTFLPPTRTYCVVSKFTGTYSNCTSNDLFMSTSHQGCFLDGNGLYNDYTYLGVLLARGV